jgi:hypothetical protein
MHTTIARFAGIFFIAATLNAASADSTQVTTQGASSAADHVAIQGYDVVSYFTDGRPTKGRNDITMLFDDSRWQFASDAHKQMFAADPDHYLPQYGGLCAGGMAMGVSVPANPQNWVIVDGKLYMVAGGKADLDDWEKNASANIKAADAQWAKLQGE